jgi:hypothetical protein
MVAFNKQRPSQERKNVMCDCANPATQKQRVLHRNCPDYDGRRQLCLAATGQMIPSRRQQMRYCATDDYDNCPIYLCKALRSSSSHGLDRDPMIDSCK